MIKNLCFLLFFSILLWACQSNGEDNDYFYTLNDEFFLKRGDPDKIKDIYLRELKLYEQTHEKKYLISSKYTNVQVLKDKRLAQIDAIYDLLKENDGEYNYITTICNYYLASKFEKSLPKSALSYINDAIAADEVSVKKIHLPHLYHFKGRVLYNMGHYRQAMHFFLKAMKIHQERNQMLFVSSMHNNLGMCYAKMGNIKEAIHQTLFAINIINEIKSPTEEEKSFLYYLKGSLADYYNQTGELTLTSQLYDEQWKFALQSKNTEQGLIAAKGIVRLRNEASSGNVTKKNVIDSLHLLLPFIVKPNEKVDFYEIETDYFHQINDAKDYRTASQNLIAAIRENKEFNNSEKEKNFEATDRRIVENFNKDYLQEKKKNILLMFLVLFICLVLGLTIFFVLSNKRKKIALIKKDIIIAEQEKASLEENLKFQNEKLRNFHLMLNVKTETEKSFVESLKKIRKSKNIDIEEALKDLHLRINNVISLDGKNMDFINESSEENTIFKNLLSEKFPVLTKNDIKFCVYFRLGLASKEISLLEKVNEASVRVYKTKIKTKMQLPKEVGLTEYLKDLS